MDEILAIQKVEKLKGRLVIYQGNDPSNRDCEGYLECVRDENCCGATNNVSFAFITENQRILLSVNEVLEQIKLGNTSIG